ncbi:MAG: PAS domain-containing protein [Parvibaculum sp.]|uniref:PAS domain-containing protein n=1 Tax=Parvibaculum sp. TaxID=2024848 RepID=UPI0027281B69|nr:PAS domain-containing protein [Parvibaculum sp.]MDO8837969.1 PAS domain-containing protein [Parvibaculum sp.]
MHGMLSASQTLSAVIAEHAGAPDEIRPHLTGAALPAALHYWESLRGARRFPARSDFDPMALRQHLPVIYLMEATPEGEFRYRVVGEMISEFFGTGSPVGRTPQDVFGATAEVALAPYRLVCQRGCLYTHTASAAWLYKNRNYVHYRVLLLPMGKSEARVDRILGVVEFVAEEAARGD